MGSHTSIKKVLARHTYQFNQLAEHHVKIDWYWLFFVDDRSHFFAVVCKQILHEAVLCVKMRLTYTRQNRNSAREFTEWFCSSKLFIWNKKLLQRACRLTNQNGTCSYFVALWSVVFWHTLASSRLNFTVNFCFLCVTLCLVSPSPLNGFYFVQAMDHFKQN